MAKFLLALIVALLVGGLTAYATHRLALALALRAWKRFRGDDPAPHSMPLADLREQTGRIVGILQEIDKHASTHAASKGDTYWIRLAEGLDVAARKLQSASVLVDVVSPANRDVALDASEVAWRTRVLYRELWPVPGAPMVVKHMDMEVLLATLERLERSLGTRTEPQALPSRREAEE